MTVQHSLIKLDATIKLAQEFSASSFPHEDSSSAVAELLDHLNLVRGSLRTASAEELKEHAERQAGLMISNALETLGIIANSANVRNAFEIHGPVLELAKNLLSKTVRLILTFEWKYMPYALPIVPSNMKDVAVIGLPASEASNALVLPMVGHELGHLLWDSRGMVEEITSIARRTALKLNWLRISDGLRVGAELLVRGYPADNRLKASIAVLDPDFATLAALMMTSAMPKAAIFVEENADRIFASGSLAGAAAAYIALATGRAQGRILDYIHRFERLGIYPDCMALAAWRMTRFPERNQDLRTAALDAFRAGPPFFSFGVVWILDALTILGPDDPEASRYADIVRQVAVRLDTSQIFTTVRV